MSTSTDSSEQPLDVGEQPRMQWQLLWFILAGFVLGFITSTLWEWMHFRRERMRLRDQRVAQLEEEVLRLEEERRDATLRAGAWQSPGYRSPGIFLESEEAAEPAHDQEPAPPESVGRESSAFVESRTAYQAAAHEERAHGAHGESELPQDEAEAEAGFETDELMATVREAVDQEPPDTAPAQEQRAAETAGPAAVERISLDEEKDEEEEAPEPAPKPPGETLAQRMQRRSVRATGFPDNLTRVKGIGRVYAKRLNDAGIFTWHQLSQTDVEILRDIVNPPVSADLESWQEQARKLAEKHGRVGAAYVGPAPDDLTRIRGIGPGLEERLYKSGIFTFAQLREISLDLLADIIPTPATGEEIDFTAWIAQARELAAEREVAAAVDPDHGEADSP